MKTMDDTAFVKRVRQRCAELGRSEREVLRRARLSHDYLQLSPLHGRRINHLESLAAELDWSLADIIGLTGGNPVEG
jgi:hypothetical protein